MSDLDIPIAEAGPVRIARTARIARAPREDERRGIRSKDGPQSEGDRFPLPPMTNAGYDRWMHIGPAAHRPGEPRMV